MQEIRNSRIIFPLFLAHFGCYIALLHATGKIQGKPGLHVCQPEYLAVDSYGL